MGMEVVVVVVVVMECGWRLLFSCHSACPFVIVSVLITRSGYIKLRVMSSEDELYFSTHNGGIDVLLKQKNKNKKLTN